MNPLTKTAPASLSPPRWEFLTLLLILVTFCAVNLVTAVRSPTVWQDEAMWTDPAANMAAGKGFVSTAWFQPDGEFFAGNVPLPAICLRLWLGLTGFSPTAVRAVYYLWTALAVLLLWRVCATTRIVPKPRLRLALVATLLCGYGFSYVFRCGRPDAIGFFLTVCILQAMCAQKRMIRLTVVPVLAALVPFAGLQLVPYFMTMSAIALLLLGRRIVLPVVLLGLGLALGGCSLVFFYDTHHVLPAFLGSIANFDGVSTPFIEKLGLIARQSVFDLSADVLILTAGVLWWYKKRPRVRFAFAFGLLSGLAVPVLVSFAGKYPDYYTWMAYVPLCVGVFAQLGEPSLPPRARQIVFGGLIVATLVGLPSRLAITALEWEARDYRPVEEFVSQQIVAGDRVYCDYQAYYPAMQIATRVYLPPYLPIMKRAERDKVTVLIINPKNLPKLQQTLGGQWKPGVRLNSSYSRANSILTRQHRVSPLYDLQVFRRISPQSANTG